LDVDRDRVICSITVGDVLDWCRAKEYDLEEEVIPFLDEGKLSRTRSISHQVMLALDKRGTIGCAVQSAIGTPKAQLRRYAHASKNRKFTGSNGESADGGQS